MISNQTPWRKLELQGLGWDLSLTSRQDFADVINELSSLDHDSRRAQRTTVHAQAVKLLQDPEIVQQNIKLFRDSLEL